MTTDSTSDALRKATNAVTMAGERLIGPEIDERTVAFAMLASGVGTLSRLMPAADLRQHMASLADGMGEPEAQPLAPHLAGLTALSEPLDDMPAAAAVQREMRRAIEGGAVPADVIEGAFSALIGLLYQVEGARKSSARLLVVAQALASMEAPVGMKPN